MPKYLQYKKVLLQVLFLLAFAILSIIYIRYTLRRIENEKSNCILQICKSIGASLPKDALSKLDATPSDAEKPQYQLIKSTLRDIIRINKSARFAYLYTQRSGKLYFIADSEPESSKDYAPPGEEYDGAPLEYKQPFTDGKVLITNAITDRWGTWRSILIPIIDNTTGKTTSVFGMDFNAISWRYITLYEALKSGMLVFLLLILSIISIKIKAKNTSLKNEVIQRKQIEETLLENREQYKLIADKMTDVVWLMDLKGRSLYVSPSITNFTGFSVEEYLNQTIDDRFTAESAKIAKEIIYNEAFNICSTSEISKEFKLTLQLEYVCKNKETKWGELMITPYFDTKKQLIRVHGVTRDITKRKLAEIALQESEDRYQDIILSTSDWVWEIDEEWKYCYCSESIENILGFSAAEILGKTPFDLMTQEEKARLETYFQNIIETKSIIHGLENWNLHKDGHRVCLLTDGFPIFDKRGNLTGYRGVDKDITKRKQAEKALKESTIFLETLMNAIPAPVFYKDTEGRYLGFNSSFEALYGDICKNLIGKSVFDIAPRELAEVYHAKDTELFDHPGIQVYESQLTDSKGTTHDVIFHKATFNDNNGNVRGLIGVILNITEHKQAEAKLNRTLALLDASIESTDNGILIVDSEGKTIKVNNRFIEIWSIPQELIASGNNEDILNHILAQLPHANKSRAKLDQINSNANTSSFSIVYLNDGRVFERLTKPMLANNTPIGRVWSYHDITERKRTEKNLRMSEEKYHQLFDQMMDGFALHEIILNDEGKPIDYLFLEVNKTYEQITGLNAEEIIGKTVREILPNTEPIWIEKYGKVAIEGIPTHFQQFSAELNKTFEVSAFSPTNRKFATIVRDITERKKIEREIRMLANAMKSINECVSITDMGNRIIFVNESFLKTYGYNENELIGKSIDLVRSPNNSPETVNKILPSTLNGGWDGELLNIRKDGHEFPIQLSTSIIYDKNAKPFGLIGVSSDITERNLAEREIRMLANAMKNINESVNITDMDGKIIFVNDSFVKTYGYTEDEIIGKNISILHSPNTPSKTFKRILPSTLGGRWDGELLNIKKDGSEFPVYLSTSTIHDKGSKPFAIIGVSLDITERKQAEELLRQSEERYRTLVINVGEGIVYVDPDEVFEFANPVAEEIFGVTQGGLVGRNLKEFISTEQFIDVRKHTNMRAKGERSSYEIDVIRCDGEKRNILISAVPQFDDNGNFKGAYGVFRDITSRKQNELIIQKQNQELKQLNSTKDKFLSIIAHDLKSPFNTLLGLTELLVENFRIYDADTVQEIVENLHSTTQQTYKLLENLLDWARSQQNRIEYNPKRIDLTSIANEIVNLLKPTADAKNIHLIQGIKKEYFALADTYMINAIFRNLINNAIKFTRSEGSIEIRAKKQGSMVQISVSDSGVGINPESVYKLFRIDSNISQQGTSGEKGTGLGLILCREFVEKHGGKIWVESEVGKGSTFYFTLKNYNDKI